MCDGFESERNQCEDLGSRQGMQAEKGPHNFTSQLYPHLTTTEMAEAGIPAVDRMRLTAGVLSMLRAVRSWALRQSCTRVINVQPLQYT